MLRKKDLLKDVDEQYHDMLSQVSISNFTKCIAQFAGLQVTQVPDNVIKKYLTTWAKNKYQFFEMLGNKLQKDIDFEFQNYDKTIEVEFANLEKEFPVYYHWIEMFNRHKKNKIDFDMLQWHEKNIFTELEWTAEVRDMAITKFFKSRLNAPDELVTAIGRIYENDIIKGKYTISIDPVDMMTASENPYNWCSCYRLTVPNDASHADGCLAAVLDTSSLITYVWDKEGDMGLYDVELTNIRWKRMREWIAIEPKTHAAIHFNTIYPGKDNYPGTFEKQLREMVENWVWETTPLFSQNDIPNLWKKMSDMNNQNVWCDRINPYGYGEYSHWRIYALSNYLPTIPPFYVYDEEITCPCGCGELLPGSDQDEDSDEGYWTYDGYGFVYEDFTWNDPEPEQVYCEYYGDYCPNACRDEICEDNCAGCDVWEECHPRCELDNEEICERYESENVYYDSECDPTGYSYTSHCSEEQCHGCPLYSLHHPENN